eukprot:Sspe_Gene.107302::Locus_85404_Transcript_2_2_Confidence_0.667_Length_634::g.107302::m.107302
MALTKHKRRCGHVVHRSLRGPLRFLRVSGCGWMRQEQFLSPPSSPPPLLPEEMKLLFPSFRILLPSPLLGYTVPPRLLSLSKSLVEAGRRTSLPAELTAPQPSPP